MDDLRENNRVVAVDENIEKRRRKRGFGLTHFSNRINPCEETEERDVPPPPNPFFLGDSGDRSAVTLKQSWF